ncbi:hypothetical protein Godav_006395, partial [Gossypium davidsonii]|nr:hypothetical protein [Gossypium davidsonii]MBA0620706.1 hypothetical protein [Gossypium davidsonii]
MKLISARSDPLLAEEIFDVAITQPGFRHSYSSFLVLILKLGRSKHFSLVDDLLVRLKSDQYRVTPTLFSYLIKIYAEADLPEKALSVFYKMLEFNVKPLPRHLNRILELLVSHHLLEDMLNKGFEPDSLSYTTLLNSLCRKKKLREAYKLLCRMKVKGCNPDIVHYNTVILGFCREGTAMGAVKVLE